jgi:hypothetical protein
VLCNRDTLLSYEGAERLGSPRFRRDSEQPATYRTQPTRGLLIAHRKPETSYPRIVEPTQATGIRDVLDVRLQGRMFVQHNEMLTKKDVGFWIGMALWIAPPLLVLIVWATWGLGERGTDIVAHHAAEAPAVERASSNGVGPVAERHTHLNVLFGAPAKLGVHSSQP